MRNFYTLLELPPQIVATTFGVALILCLSPYFAGGDFGILKVPDFVPQIRRRLKIIGPLVLAIVLAGFIPIFPPNVRQTNPLKEVTERIQAAETVIQKLADLESIQVQIKQMENQYKDATRLFAVTASEQLESECMPILAKLKAMEPSGAGLLLKT